jgi:hypothetical protein
MLKRKAGGMGAGVGLVKAVIDHRQAREKSRPGNTTPGATGA